MSKWIIVITLVFVIISVVAPFGAAENSVSYNIIIKNNGESVILISLEEPGTYNITVPIDAKIEGKGVLYTIEIVDEKTKTINAYRGLEKKGLIAYSTLSYTKMNEGKWDFSMACKECDKVNILLPKDALIKITSPKAVIDSNKLQFTNPQDINILYSLSDINKTNIFVILIVVSLLIGTAVIVLVFIIFRPIKKPSAKEHILKTLPHNERKIIKIILEENGLMKRNALEKKSMISKSSLANSLNNLEKKNIISIDKAFTVHTVKLTEWFKGL